ncbi:MAG: hypothetical protein HFE57_08585 [Firmicutes bacterium]|jgi:hypothetical protein|nr:hypothetical protein [Bacillota bacterium]
MKKIMLLFVFVFLLTACVKEETKTSYLQQFIKEDTTILDCFDCSNEKKITEELLLTILDNEIGFLEKEYEVKEPENPEPNQVYEVVSKEEEPIYFKVYYINNTGIITADRTFIDKAIALAEQKDVYAGIRYGIYIGQYNIGKQNIQETDTEYINKAETYLQSIFPYLNFDDYTVRVIYGDAGQTSFNYYADKTPKENQARDFGWTSPLKNSYIDITISRNLLDKLLYNK